ncbi:MAG: aspartate kinase [Thaumarchaeota archaeon]|nr:aspartate kinase [Nitrososphaerota archaeon]MCS4539080.1 aspartate kinase [Nitrososphaerota archaeon]
MLVFKFGGTSVKDGKRVRHVAKLVEANRKKHLVVVCSALDGVTDELIHLSEDASKGAERVVEERLRKLRISHEKVLRDALRKEQSRRRVARLLSPTLNQLERTARGAATLRELTPRSKDLILSSGERLSAPIVAGALSEVGLKADYLTGGEAGVITDDNFGDAMPLVETSKLQIRQTLDPMVESGTIPVVAGYIGLTQAGDLTTLGRGGSDFTATLIASALMADEVWIWSDVDGLMTADPRIVKHARLLKQVSYAEAGEMAVFGAKALHPRTLEPVAELGIPVRFRNTFNPRNEGTVVSAKTNVDSRRVVKSVALIGDVAIITVSGASMVGKPGSAARIFDVVAKSGSNILMISQSVSESNIGMVVKRATAQKAVNALEIALLGEGGLKQVLLEDDVSAIAVIGGGMRGTPGIAAKVFGAVSSRGINVRMIAQGSSEQNISFCVDQKDGKQTVALIHSVFELGDKS